MARVLGRRRPPRGARAVGHGGRSAALRGGLVRARRVAAHGAGPRHRRAAADGRRAARAPACAAFLAGPPSRVAARGARASGALADACRAQTPAAVAAAAAASPSRARARPRAPVARTRAVRSTTRAPTSSSSPPTRCAPTGSTRARRPTSRRSPTAARASTAPTSRCRARSRRGSRCSRGATRTTTASARCSRAGRSARATSTRCPSGSARAGYATGVVSDYAGDVFSRIDLGFGLVDVPEFDFRQLVRQHALERETPLMPVLHSRLGRAAFPVMREMNDAADPQMLARDAVRAMRSLEARGPFFLVVFFSTAHFPYAAPVALLRALHRRELPRPLQVRQARGPRGRRRRPTRATRSRCAALYDGAVTAIDDAAQQRARRARGRRHREEHDRRGHGRPRRDALRPRPRPGARRSPLRRRGDARAARRRRSAVLAAHASPRAAREAAIARDVDLAPTLYALTGVRAAGGPRRAVARPGAATASRSRPRLAYAETGLWFTEDIPGLPGRAAPALPRHRAADGGRHAARRRARAAEGDEAPDARGEAPDGARRPLQAPLRADAHGRALDALRHAGGPGEEHDVAAAHPDVVARLRASSGRWMRLDPDMTERDGYLVPRDDGARAPAGRGRGARPHRRRRSVVAPPITSSRPSRRHRKARVVHPGDARARTCETLRDASLLLGPGPWQNLSRHPPTAARTASSPASAAGRWAPFTRRWTRASGASWPSSACTRTSRATPARPSGSCAKAARPRASGTRTSCRSWLLGNEDGAPFPRHGAARWAQSRGACSTAASGCRGRGARLRPARHRGGRGGARRAGHPSRPQAVQRLRRARPRRAALAQGGGLRRLGHRRRQRLVGGHRRRRGGRRDHRLSIPRAGARKVRRLLRRRPVRARGAALRVRHGRAAVLGHHRDRDAPGHPVGARRPAERLRVRRPAGIRRGRRPRDEPQPARSLSFAAHVRGCPPAVRLRAGSLLLGRGVHGGPGACRGQSRAKARGAHEDGGARGDRDRRQQPRPCPADRGAPEEGKGDGARRTTAWPSRRAEMS